MPLKKAGIHIGNTTASFRSFFASSRSAMLSLRNRVDRDYDRWSGITPIKLLDKEHTNYNSCSGCVEHNSVFFLS